MVAPKGDWWSEVFLRKLGITWKSTTQWFWVRNLILHLPAGIVIGLAAWCLSLIHSVMWAIIGGVLLAVLLWKESREAEKQGKLKTAFDVCFWLLGFMGVWIITNLI